MRVARLGVVGLLLVVTVAGCASAPGQSRLTASKSTATSAATASAAFTREAVNPSTSALSGGTPTSALLIPVTPLMRTWALVSVQVGGVMTAIDRDTRPSLLLRQDGSSLMVGYCQGREGRWAAAEKGFVLTEQQDQLFSCPPPAPSLMQLFSYGALAELTGTVTVAMSNGNMIVSTASR